MIRLAGVGEAGGVGEGGESAQGGRRLPLRFLLLQPLHLRHRPSRRLPLGIDIVCIRVVTNVSTRQWPSRTSVARCAYRTARRTTSTLCSVRRRPILHDNAPTLPIAGHSLRSRGASHDMHEFDGYSTSFTRKQASVPQRCRRRAVGFFRPRTRG